LRLLPSDITKKYYQAFGERSFAENSRIMRGNGAGIVEFTLGKKTIAKNFYLQPRLFETLWRALQHSRRVRKFVAGMCLAKTSV
jgi:hypothetical protein